MPNPPCEGHPAGPFDPMGETVYCDGSCRAGQRYVVSTCHDGTDWCVRDASDEEVIEGEWVATHEDALHLAASSAAEQGCRYYDFSTGGSDA